MTGPGLARDHGFVKIRALEEGEWEVLRDIRLDALADAPYAFCATLAEESNLAEAQWRARVRDQVFVAAEGGQVVGVAGCFPHSPDTVGIWGMWVKPASRGSKIGSRLLEAVEHWAETQGADRLVLSVEQNNRAAERLYLRYGFTPTGRVHPLREGSPLVEVELERHLARRDI